MTDQLPCNRCGQPHPKCTADTVAAAVPVVGEPINAQHNVQGRPLALLILRAVPVRMSGGGTYAIAADYPLAGRYAEPLRAAGGR